MEVTSWGGDDISLWLNDLMGGFTGPSRFPAGNGAYGIAAGDANFDSIPDLVVGNKDSDSVTVLLNDGTGDFDSVLTTWGGVGGRGGLVGFADFDRDSLPDVAAEFNDTPGDYICVFVNCNADPCHCPVQSDFDEDGFLTAVDLSHLIDILFAGSPDIRDPWCPSPRADFDCDGFSTATDLARLIDHLFVGGGGPCDPCAK